MNPEILENVNLVYGVNISFELEAESSMRNPKIKMFNRSITLFAENKE